jgi:hypothetical protein
MSNNRAVMVMPNEEQRLREKILRLNGVYEHRDTVLFTLADMEKIPTFREILQSKSFNKLRKIFPDIDVYELKERDIAIQKFVINRYLREIAVSVDDRQCAREYVRVLGAFERYAIDGPTFLSRVDDKAEREDLQDLLKSGAAAYVKVRLAQYFEAATFSDDDMSIIESPHSSPNQKLESLLRPFKEAVTYDERTRSFNKPEWFELLGVLEQAGFDLDEPGLAEAIKPENTYINTFMDYPQSSHSAEPA